MIIQPEETPGYWLARTQQQVAASYVAALQVCCQQHQKPYVVTPSQYNVLALLTQRDGTTAGMISQLRQLDPPVVTAALTHLERFGLVKRVHSREDRRVVQVYLTQEGRDLTVALSETLSAFTSQMTQGISSDALRTMHTTLQQILANVSSDTHQEDIEKAP